MSAARILTLYRAIFVALLSLASLQALLLWRPTQVVGACVLLGIFAVAQVLSALEGQWPTRFLQYAASTLLIVAMGRAIRSA
jgi:hypothetical protein